MAEARRRPDGCLSDVELEELLAGDMAGTPGEARARAHVEGCERCRALQVAFTAGPAITPSAEAWRPLLAGAAGAGAATSAGRPRRRVFALAGGGAAAAAAALVLVWRLGGGAPDAGGGGADERIKGSGLALTVHVRRAGGAVDRVTAAGELRPGEEMRFEIASARAGQAVVLGLDAKANVTVYAPAPGAAAGPARVEPTGPALLDGSIVADDTPGFERVFALVCPPEVTVEALRAQAARALAAAGGRPEALKSLGTADCLESSVLFSKRAR